MSRKNLILLLRSLGITPCYVGFSFLLYAVAIVQHDRSSLNHVIKDIYFPIAQHFDTNWRNVEHNLRTLTHRAWKTDKDLLCQIAGYPLNASPSVSQFIESLAFFVTNAET